MLGQKLIWWQHTHKIHTKSCTSSQVPISDDRRMSSHGTVLGPSRCCWLYLAGTMVVHRLRNRRFAWSRTHSKGLWGQRFSKSCVSLVLLVLLHKTRVVFHVYVIICLDSSCGKRKPQASRQFGRPEDRVSGQHENRPNGSSQQANSKAFLETCCFHPKPHRVLAFVSEHSEHHLWKSLGADM